MEEEGGGDVVGTMLQLLRQPPPNTRLQLSTGHEYNAVSLLISNTTRPEKGKTKIQIFCKYCTKTLLILATKAMTKSNILPGAPILRGAIFPIEDSIHTEYSDHCGKFVTMKDNGKIRFSSSQHPAASLLGPNSGVLYVLLKRGVWAQP